ncbi:DUF4260 family protein [Amycolatopsis sp. NEAU-NG30]|uniref:DUF4260 family protein n=1 Tax=Amycolatopsis melonis TaxID=3156488 RepID=A0ABV0L976_9PSEU
MSALPATARHVLRRTAWAALAVFLLAFLALEVVNHGVPALIAGLLLLLVPDLPKRLGNGSRKALAWHNFLHRPWIPLAVLVVYSAGGLGDWVPLFTAGLGWLAHIAVERVFGGGRRVRTR